MLMGQRVSGSSRDQVGTTCCSTNTFLIGCSACFAIRQSIKERLKSFRAPRTNVNHRAATEMSDANTNMSYIHSE
jgi:hypothetical protein